MLPATGEGESFPPGAGRLPGFGNGSVRPEPSSCPLPTTLGWRLVLDPIRV